jgi:hypothetical protein
MTVTYSLSVSYQTTPQYVPGRTQGFRVVMNATVVSGFADAGVFVFLRAGTIDQFQCLASPAQLVDLPLNAPTPASQGFFRQTGLDMIFPCKDDGQEFIAAMVAPPDGAGNQGEVYTLCSEMGNLGNNLSIPTVQVISG